MNLQEYVGKRIKLIAVNGKVFEGKCTDYTQALDNDPEIDSIGIETVSGADYGYEIYENEIKSIEIIT